MRIFLTGATGFIGTHLVPELIGGGHRVTGLSRSDAGAASLAAAGAAVVRGDVNDPSALRDAARNADAVIHAAFNHDAGDVTASSERDRQVIATLGEALAGSGRRLIVTSGTGLVRPPGGRPAIETDPHAGAADFPRAATEDAADALIAAGGNVVVLRLSQVHDTRRQGRISWHIDIARAKGRVAYVGEGTNRLAAVHVSDAVRLYRLALEHGAAGAHYHAVAEEGVAMRDIAAVIGTRLGLPVDSISREEAPGYFGAMAPLTLIDLAASSALTRQQLGWTPTGADLLTDLANLDDGPT